MDNKDISQEQETGNWRFFGVHAVAYMRSLPDGIGVFSADGTLLDVAKTHEEAHQALESRRLQPVALH